MGVSTERRADSGITGEGLAGKLSPAFLEIT